MAGAPWGEEARARGWGALLGRLTVGSTEVLFYLDKRGAPEAGR